MSPSGHTVPLLKDRLICTPSKVPPETSASCCFRLLRVTSAPGHRESFQEEEEEHSDEIRAPCSQQQQYALLQNGGPANGDSLPRPPALLAQHSMLGAHETTEEHLKSPLPD